MTHSIDSTLKSLDRWFNEPSEGSDRPKLISKLALLELCGWLEVRFDAMIFHADSLTINDAKWTEKMAKSVSGFDYEKHFRGMLVNLVGELNARKIELAMEEENPGDLDRLKHQLSELWKKRCNMAHADMITNIASQTTFDAPSWAINQYRILSKLLEKYKNTMEVTLSD